MGINSLNYEVLFEIYQSRKLLDLGGGTRTVVSRQVNSGQSASGRFALPGNQLPPYEVQNHNFSLNSCEPLNSVPTAKIR